MTYLTLIAFLEDPYNYSHWRLWFKVWIWRGHITSLQKNLWIYVYFVLYFLNHQFSPVQSLSHAQFFAASWIAAHQASLSITNSQSLLKLMSIESVMLFKHFILCHPLLLLPSMFPSIRVFSSESVLHIRWPSIGVSSSASVLPMNIQDWFPLGLTGLISIVLIVFNISFITLYL